MFTSLPYFMAITIFSLHCMHINEEQYIQKLCTQYKKSQPKQILTPEKINTIKISKTTLHAIKSCIKTIPDYTMLNNDQIKYLEIIIQAHNQLSIPSLTPHDLYISSNLKKYKALCSILEFSPEQQLELPSFSTYLFNRCSNIIQQLENIENYGLADFTNENKRIDWILKNKLITNTNASNCSTLSNDNCIACRDHNTITQALTLFLIRKKCFLPNATLNNECKASGHLVCFSRLDKQLQKEILNFHLIFVDSLPTEYIEFIPTDESPLKVYTSLKNIAHLLGFEDLISTSFLDS